MLTPASSARHYAAAMRTRALSRPLWASPPCAQPGRCGCGPRRWMPLCHAMPAEQYACMIRVALLLPAVFFSVEGARSVLV
eukprot:603126-Pyramimonas_sp.AAC.1